MSDEEVKATCLACSQKFDPIEIIECNELPVCEVCASEAEQ
jgi:hypothetical protein